MEVARQTLASDGLVDVGVWESTQPGHWPDFPQVCSALAGALRGLGPRFPKIFYACGSDHANKCGLYSGLGEFGVVVVPREGESVESESPANSVYVASPAPGAMASFSSTKGRAALANRDLEGVTTSLSPEAAKFMLQPSLADFERFRSDYTLLGVDGPVL